MKTLDVLQIALAIGFIVAILPLAELKCLRKVEDAMCIGGVVCVCLSMVLILTVELVKTFTL
jgi:hypothetical protein